MPLHDDLEFVLEIENKANLVQGILEGRFDLGVMQSSGTESSHVLVTPFRQSDLHCVVPKGHALSNVPIVQIKDLIDVPLIGFATDALNKRLIDNEFSRLGEVPNWIIQMRDNEIAIEFVSRGLGVTILTPFPFVERYLDMVEVVKFEMTYPRAIVFISNSDKPESDFARSFRSHLREFSQKYSYSYPVDR